jgi:Mg/Co/Ni transporter MgtE
MHRAHCCDAAIGFALQHAYVILRQRRNNTSSQRSAKDKAMIFSTIVARTQDRLAKRAKYRRLVAEIESMSNRDLVDLRADRSEMLYQAYRSVYG